MVAKHNDVAGSAARRRAAGWAAERGGGSSSLAVRLLIPSGMVRVREGEQYGSGEGGGVTRVWRGGVQLPSRRQLEGSGAGPGRELARGERRDRGKGDR